MQFRLEGDGTLTTRLYRGIRRAILDGRIAPGRRLPATRVIADELNVARNVVLRAYAQLVLEGFAEARPGSGTYVCHEAFATYRARRSAPQALTAQQRPPALSARARRIQALAPLPAPGTPPRAGLRYDFRYGSPDLIGFPQDTWARLVTRRARRLSIAALEYGSTKGYAPLRAAIAAYLAQTRGIDVTSGQIVIVNGTQQALELIAAMLLDEGDRVVVEDPGYQAARNVFGAAGASMLAVPADDAGIDSARLPEGTFKLAYLTPAHQFPLGGVLPLARRLVVLEWAARTGAYVIEDDYDGEFRYGAAPVDTLKGLDRGGRVLYVGSFSKVLYPSMRIGYVVLPPPLVEPLVGLKFVADHQTPTFEQAVLADFMTGGHFERHLRRTRTRHAARRAILLAALDEHLGGEVEVTGANAGVHVVAWLRGLDEADLGALIAQGVEHGLGLYSVAPYYVAPPDRAGLLLGYASLHERDIRDGVAVLAGLVRERLRACRSAPSSFDVSMKGETQDAIHVDGQGSRRRAAEA
jgi:GntR family transcriptional regulator/MocR family aminotransferase